MPDESIAPGQTIRINGWPGTKGKTFVVKAVEPFEGPSWNDRNDPTVHAWEVVGERGRGRLRSFPLSCVTLKKGRPPEHTVAGPDLTIGRRKSA